MNIRKAINCYVECNEFYINIKNNKVYIYYYDSIENFSSSSITILNEQKKYIIKGSNLAIETMFEELVVVSGDINNIGIN